MDFYEEESTLKRFQNLYSQFPSGEISHPEKPDFIIKGERVIGIELTQVFKDQDDPKGSLIRAKDTFRINLLANLAETLNKTDFPKCSIAAHINDKNFSRKLDARAICKLCLPEILLQRNNIINDGE